MDTRSGIIATVARLALVLGFALASAPVAAGASFPNLEIWLDRPLPTDAAQGETVAVGAIVWDRVLHQPIAGMPISVRVGEATGEPVRALEDWPGHIAVEVVAPAGGLDGLDFGIVGTVCVNDECGQEFESMTVAGVGPPTGAALPALAEAAVQVVSTRPVAGRPIELEVQLLPRVNWDPSAFEPPATLQVELRRQRGAAVDDAEFGLSDPAGRRYAGSLVAAEPGDYVVQVAAVAADGRAAIFGGSVTRVSVAEAAGPSAAGSGPAAGTGPLEPWVLPVIAVVVVSVGALVLVVRRLDF